MLTPARTRGGGERETGVGGLGINQPQGMQGGGLTKRMTRAGASQRGRGVRESHHGATTTRGTGEPRRRQRRVEHGPHDDGVAALRCRSRLPTSGAVERGSTRFAGKVCWVGRGRGPLWRPPPLTPSGPPHRRQRYRRVPEAMPHAPRRSVPQLRYRSGQHMAANQRTAVSCVSYEPDFGVPGVICNSRMRGNQVNMGVLSLDHDLEEMEQIPGLGSGLGARLGVGLAARLDAVLRPNADDTADEAIPATLLAHLVGRHWESRGAAVAPFLFSFSRPPPATRGAPFLTVAHPMQPPPPHTDACAPHRATSFRTATPPPPRFVPPPTRSPLASATRASRGPACVRARACART